MKKQNLTQLGKKTTFADSPDKAIIDTVPNPHPGTDYAIRFTCPEFTSICPITGQPDFAHIVIDYVPNKKIVESKSLKLYFFSFRNHGAFHEDCTVLIAKRLIKELSPKWLKIGGYWFPRGGMPIDVFYEYGKKPASVNVPPQGVPPYRGR
jgi:7-cyano-7-deazaguanine reductase